MDSLLRTVPLLLHRGNFHEHRDILRPSVGRHYAAGKVVSCFTYDPPGVTRLAATNLVSLF